MAKPAALALFWLISAGTLTAQAAETPAAVFVAYGLTGSWSAACDRPVSPRNPRFTFEPKPGGLIDSVGDYGEDGPTHAAVREAFIDGDHRLHTTTYTLFEGLPKAMREALGKTGERPSFINRSIFVMGADKGLSTEDMVTQVDGAPDTMHLVSGGHTINPRTQAQGPKVQVRFRCSE